MEIHFLAVYPNIGDLAACGDDFLTQLGCSGNTDALVAQDTARLATRQIPFEDMEVCAADSCFADFDDGICWRGDFRLGAIQKSLLADRLVNQGFHDGARRLA